MTNDEMRLFLDAYFERIRRTREAGQAEYAHDASNVFANFDRIAAALGQEREEVMMTYALKHVDGIVAYVRGHRSQREDILGRVDDLILYLLLFAASVSGPPPEPSPEVSCDVPCSLCGFSHEPTCDEFHASYSTLARFDR